MGLDLGSLLGMGISAVSNYQMQKLTTVPVNDSPFIPNVIENIFSETQQVNEQGMVMGPGGCGTHPKRVLGYLDANGNFCKKKSRKRRRRLATRSDVKDLASLKGILGNGKAFETWIATH